MAPTLARPARRAPARPGGHAPRPGRRPDRHRAGRSRPAHPPHLRALVHQGRAAVAAGGHGAHRLLYAHRLLLDPGYTVEDVALKLGYSKTKTLQMHLRAVFGLTAGELRVSLSHRRGAGDRHPAATSPSCAGRPPREAADPDRGRRAGAAPDAGAGAPGPWATMWCPSATRTSPTSCCDEADSTWCCSTSTCRRCRATRSSWPSLRRWPRLAEPHRADDRRSLGAARPTLARRAAPAVRCCSSRSPSMCCASPSSRRSSAAAPAPQAQRRVERRHDRRPHRSPPRPTRSPRCGSTGRSHPGDFAISPPWPPGILDASGVVPVNAAARARPSERTIRFYVARGLVSPPDGRGTAAVYSYRHLLQVLAIKLRQMEGATLEAMTREFAGLTGDLIERRVAGALGPALPRPDRLALLQAPGTGRGRVGRAVLGWLAPVEGAAGGGHGVPPHRRGARHRGADRRAASGPPPQRRRRRHRRRAPPGARRPGRLLDSSSHKGHAMVHDRACWSSSSSSCSGSSAPTTG